MELKTEITGTHFREDTIQKLEETYNLPIVIHEEIAESRKGAIKLLNKSLKQGYCPEDTILVVRYFGLKESRLMKQTWPCEAV